MVTYTGANETHRPAAAAGRAARRAARRPRRHRRRAAATQVARPAPAAAFDPRNLARRLATPFSFDPRRAAGAQAAAGRRASPAPCSPDLGCRRAGRRRPRLGSLVAFLQHPVRAFLRGASTSPCPTRATRSPTGCRSSSTASSSGRSATGCCATCSRGRDSRARARQTEWRRGALPPGQLGWRLGQRLTTRRPARRRDGRVGHPGAGRRRASTSTSTSATAAACAARSRPLRRPLVSRSPTPGSAPGTSSRPGSRCSRCARPTRPALDRRRDRPGRAGRSATRTHVVRRRSPTTPRRPAARPGRDLRRRACASRCRCRSRPATPGPRRQPTPPTRRAARPTKCKWATDSFAGEHADAAHVAVWGARRSARACCSPTPPRPGEEWDGETTRLGALALRLWQPMLDRVR